MLKHELRQVFREKRNAIDSEQFELKSIQISNRLLRLPIWKFSFYHLFLTIKKQKEIDTQPILTLLQGKDKNIVLPKVKDNQLQNFLLTDDSVLNVGKWGVPEPTGGIEIEEEKIDVVFVPLLAYDLKGNRVGYGKGYYDNFLTKCRPNVLKIGLSYFPPVSEVTDVQSNDVPLDYCVTPDNVYQFKS